MIKHDISDWESYWSAGNLTSCAGAYGGNYEGSIRTFWDKRFAALPDGSRMLDIGTGNGAVALLAAAAAQRLGRRFSIDALDLADISPAVLADDTARALLPDIRFHPRTDAADSDFDNDSFDLITGNFALEYTDWPLTVRELARLTEAGGEHLFVMHCSESVIVRTARQELTHIDLVLKETTLLDRARQLVETIAAAGIGSATPQQRQRLASAPGVETCRLALNKASSQVSAAISRSAHPEILKTALGRVSEAWRLLQSHDAPAALTHLQQTESDILANAARLHGLLRAALTKPDTDQLARLYDDAGFADVWIDTLSQEPHGLLAWTLRARSM